MSSGSRRNDSAVEPTRSQNITVRWRRSASLPVSRLDNQLGLIKFGDHAQHFTTMAKQDEPIEVLVRQFGNDAEINPILGKAQRVFAQARKLLEPVRNLLHWPHQLSGSG